MPTVKKVAIKTAERAETPSAPQHAARNSAQADARSAAKRVAKRSAQAKKPPASKRVSRIKPEPIAPKEDRTRIFALDIGTRSVIGIVAEQDDRGTMHIIATERLEHKTRAMLDGQIHDVLQVASIIRDVKAALEEKTGPLHNAAVAAAGRALYTMTAEAELDVNGLITAEQQRALDFAGVQAAQAKLATSNTVEDPTRYYCVGYSTIRYLLDDIQLKSLIGQRGKKAKSVVIATFLPRQVIDSMQSALHQCALEMRALTLEPIAAINVLIPPTMRHLNLVLVDIGAGTSDVAITKNGSVIAYGMVPLAGDEITEAISQRFLLDFNIAEQIKRRASNGETSKFTDILGQTFEMTAKEIIEPVLPNIENLASAISKTILELNTDVPQAIMLVGGGALTPHLQELVAETIGMAPGRVAVRHPDAVDGIADIPDELHSPDAVTPLGILKIASLNTLHFLSVYVNDEEYSLFNFRELTVSDALLNAGINLRKYNGRPGLGLMVSIGSETKTFPGTLGTFAKILLNDEEADLDTVIRDGSRITVIPGENGTTPTVKLGDLVTTGEEFILYVNGREKHIRQKVTVNGEEADAERVLKDGDHIESRAFSSIGEALLAAGYPPTGRKIHYKLNGEEAVYACTPEILLDDEPVTLSMPVHEGDHIEYIADDSPKLSDILHLDELDTSLVIYYEGAEVRIPSATVSLTVNGRNASPGTLVDDGFDITYKRSVHRTTSVSDALLAVGFQPPAATSHVSFAILVNGAPADFTDPVKNGDTLEVQLTDLSASAAPAAAPDADAAAAGIGTTGIGSDGTSMPQAPTAPRTSAQTASGQRVPTLSAINAGMGLGNRPIQQRLPNHNIPGMPPPPTGNAAPAPQAQAMQPAPAPAGAPFPPTAPIPQDTRPVAPAPAKPVRRSISDFIRRD